MGLVSVEYEVYKCPHCRGYIIIRKQFPHLEPGCSISLMHYLELPDYLKGQEIKELEAAE